MTALAPPGLREPPADSGALTPRARGRKYMQLTVDGGEVDTALVRRKPWGPNQREALRQLAFGSLTSTQAGVIAHARRKNECKRRDPYGGVGCCKYAGTDGSALMKSLERAGAVVKIGGLWHRAHQ